MLVKIQPDIAVRKKRFPINRRNFSDQELNLNFPAAHKFGGLNAIAAIMLSYCSCFNCPETLLMYDRNDVELQSFAFVLRLAFEMLLVAYSLNFRGI